MITARDVIDALTKCSGYAPDKTPVPSQIVVAAWVEYFAGYPSFTRTELLDAVRLHFKSPRDQLVQPADLGRMISMMDPDPERYVPLPAGVSGDGVTPTASEEHRRKCMAQITETIGKRWSVPGE